MRDHLVRARLTCLLVTIMLGVCAFAPQVAFAEGTGDDPTPTADSVGPADAGPRAAAEDSFDIWKALNYVPSFDGSVTAERVYDPPPVHFMTTPTHSQEHSYWCGPATVQEIDDYWGTTGSQSYIASWLHTTYNGTDFSRVDDALRAFTGVRYYYYGPITTRASFLCHVVYGVFEERRPMATDVSIVARMWPNYVFDHSGHIIPMEGVDCRLAEPLIRINDPYDEGGYRAGGGQTLGHRTYTASVIWDGVHRHWRHAVVR